MKTGNYRTRAELREGVLADMLTLNYSWAEMAKRHGISLWVLERVRMEVGDAYCEGLRRVPG